MIGEYIDLQPDSPSSWTPPEDTEDKTLILCNIDRDATDDQLQAYMSSFGPILELSLLYDKRWGHAGQRSGYVTYVDRQSYLLALNSRVIINAKRLWMKTLKRKIFVTGFTYSLTVYDLQSYFAQYGRIIKIELIVDCKMNTRQEECFITYSSTRAAAKCLSNPTKWLHGTTLTVEKHSPYWQGLDLYGKRIVAVVDFLTYRHGSICGGEFDPWYPLFVVYC